MGVLQFRGERTPTFRIEHTGSTHEPERPSAQVRTWCLSPDPIWIALAFWSSHPNLIIDADTPRYLANSPFRTATYPLFLDLAEGPILLPLQLLLLAAALAWVAIYTSKSSHGSSVLQWS